MSVSELSTYTSISKYARYVEEEKRRESWEEAVGRNEGMMLDRFPYLHNEITDAYDFVREKKILGSMRAMQFGGKPMLKHNPRGYNCIGSYCDRLRFFQECFYLLLCGCGTGFSVQEHHVAHLPKFSKKRLAGIELPKKIFQIPDCIEGWADAEGALLSSYHEIPVKGFEEYHDCDIVFDPSPIRPNGSPLSCGIGRAPGPKPLMTALELARKLLDRAVTEGVKLTSLQAYDLAMFFADASVAGGVRRSATICIFSPWDLEIAAAKTGNWMRENPQRARSNNSAALLRDSTTWEDFFKLFQHTRQFGEPGFYWTDNYDIIPNPCFHRDTLLATASGLKKIGDLFLEQQNVDMVVDNRAGCGDKLDWSCVGVSLQSASNVKLTQTQADIYEVITEHGHRLKVTSNHKFPTSRGRLSLSDMVVGDTILLQSAEGRFGSFGSYRQGLLLGMIAGDGTISNNNTFIDFWENDNPDCFAIGAMVNEELKAVNSRGKKTCGNIGWQVNTIQKKARLGGTSLHRWLIDVLGIQDPLSIKKNVPACVFSGSREFVRGYLQGLYHSDGSVQMTERGKRSSFSIRLNQSNPELLRGVQVLLSNFGVVSRLYLRRVSGYRDLPDGRGGQKPYFCQDNYDLVVNRPNACVFLKSIGLYGRKAKLAVAGMETRTESCRKPERFITKVASISHCGKDDVFCLTVPSTNTVVANGVVTGQCVEIGFWPRLRTPLNSISSTYDGPIVKESEGVVLLSGWQACNLSTLNGKTTQDRYDFYERCRAASTIGTLQATFTDFPYLGPVTEQIVRKEALLGVAICGMMHKPKLFLDPEIQRVGAKVVLDTNERIAKACGINPCARGTCIKPDGKSSAILESEPGIHPGHSRRYFRVVQVNQNERPYQHFKSVNPQACELSVWSKTGTDDCIRFCIEEPEGTALKSEMTAIEMLENVRLTYMHWIQAGKRPELCTQPALSNNVSNTVTVRDHEWEDVAKHIYAHRHCFAGVSLASDSCDRDFAQAPYTAVYTPDEICKTYSVKALQYAHPLLDMLQGSGFRDLWDACDLALGFWPENLERRGGHVMWVKTLKIYAFKYHYGDIRRATYCLKDVYNWRLWCDLKDSYRNVDYSTMVEEQMTTNLQGETSCAGGACVINL